MKILVDSTVWIDFLRGTDTLQTRKLEYCIHNRDDICCCGFVLTEVFQGIKDEKQLFATKRHFAGLVYLEDTRSTFELAAVIYRDLHKRGVTIRNSIDCLIAAVAIQTKVAFLENDRDYRYIGRCYPLNRI